MKSKGKMAFLYLSLLVLLLFEKNCLAIDNNLMCTTKFCDDYVQLFPCPPLDPICSNSSRSVIIPSPTVCSCCEHCFIFQDLGQECVVGRPGQPLPNIICKPGTECVKGFCQKKKGPDPDFYPGYECKDGICNCAVLENNSIKKIFGTFKEKEDLDKVKQCGCSISAYHAQQSINRLLPFPDLYLPIPRCLANGQYDPLQCVGEMCGCVDSITGAWDLSVRKVPIRALSPGNPKCFDFKIHKFGDYYTTCEKERNSVMNEKSWRDLEGIITIFSHKVECTPDGKYATRTADL